MRNAQPVPILKRNASQPKERDISKWNNLFSVSLKLLFRWVLLRTTRTSIRCHKQVHIFSVHVPVFIEIP